MHFLQSNRRRFPSNARRAMARGQKKSEWMEFWLVIMTKRNKSYIVEKIAVESVK